MTKITRYLFGNDEALKIATRTIDEKHWYMAAVICELLGIANHSQAVHRERTDEFGLDGSEWRKATEYIGGKGKKHILMVNDNGMLKLVFQGTSPRALEIQERARITPQHLVPASWSQEILNAGK